MREQRWSQVEELFNTLIELRGQERTSRLQDECVEDHELMGVLERLLDAHDHQEARQIRRVVDCAFARAPRIIQTSGHP